ncbi:peritrophin-48 [Haematobia irritans]|uniref:peritrophin-48 n=1 Tax=Haematobia irritans TaxID=7368 RepID=UPI003F50BEEB
MAAKHLLASVAVLLALMANGASAAYNVSNYCQLVQPGTKLPSMDSCQTYYTCQSNGAYVSSACSGTENFDKNSQSCKAASTTPCVTGLDNPCSALKGDLWVPNPNDCTGWVYCSDGKNAGSGPCPNNQIFSYTKQQCVYGTCTNSDEVVIQDLCEIMPTNIYFGSFEDCTAWYTCNPDLTSGNCKTGLVYNTVKGMCLKDDGNMCNRVTNPEAPPTKACTSSDKGNTMGDGNICAVYYTCDGTEWVKSTCASPTYYDVNTGQCVNRQTAVPETGCNRCQYSTNQWVNAVNSTCQNYLTCNSDRTVSSEGTCAKDQYFNEQRQACVSTNDGLQSYQTTNGACSTGSGSSSSTTSTSAKPPTTCADDDDSCTSGSPGDSPTNAPTKAPGGSPTSSPDDSTTSAPSANETTEDSKSSETTDQE